MDLDPRCCQSLAIHSLNIFLVEFIIVAINGQLTVFLRFTSFGLTGFLGCKPMFFFEVGKAGG